MPVVGKDQRGDLYAAIEIQLPRTLTKDERQYYEALQALDSGARS
jgi:DnaJ-class molecular chaperone